MKYSLDVRLARSIEQTLSSLKNVPKENKENAIRMCNRILENLATKSPKKYAADAQKQGYREKLYEKQKGVCVCCMIHLPVELLALDHIVPKSKGGKCNYDNLQLLCSSCNSVKNDHDMRYLMLRRGGKHKNFNSKERNL